MKTSAFLRSPVIIVKVENVSLVRKIGFARSKNGLFSKQKPIAAKNLEMNCSESLGKNCRPPKLLAHIVFVLASIVLPSESPQEFHQVSGGLEAGWQPQTAFKRFYLQQMSFHTVLIAPETNELPKDVHGGFPAAAFARDILAE